MRSGTVAVTGYANAGKSTLINVLVGEKISIVSPKPQTTRDRILGVYNGEDCQIVFIDTPGLYRSETKLGSVMQKTAEQCVREADLILLIVDVHEGISERDMILIEKIAGYEVGAVVVLTKTDIMPGEKLAAEISRLNRCALPVVPVSARRNKNLKTLVKVIKDRLPEGGALYSADVVSDKSERFMLAEIMREKILLKFEKEIPHGVAVIINEFKLRQNNEIYDVSLDIICDKENHKAILIGKQGGAIKEASSFARRDMEKFLGKKVYLTTYIKVKEGWRDRDFLIKEYGYSSEEN